MGKEKEASLFEHGNQAYFAGPNSSTAYLERRRQMIPATLLEAPANLSASGSISKSTSGQPTSRYFSFEERIRSTRSAAIGEVLTENLENLNLLLPKKFEDLLYVLQAYQNNIEWHYDLVQVSLLLPRIKDFFDWWNKRSQEGKENGIGTFTTSTATLNQEEEVLKQFPPDPVLVPLLFAILALGLQSVRTTGSEKRGGIKSNISTSSSSSSPSTSSNPFDPSLILQQSQIPSSFSKPFSSKSSSLRLIPSMSSEKQFLKISGECSEALQTSCPSNFSSAYQAPLDLIRSNLLIGIWHTSELNLQFACSAFAISTRLAHSAGLHRDPKMWKGKIDKEEAFNRRTLWFGVVFFSVFHSSRLGLPPDLRPSGFDTELPNDFKAMTSIWRKAQGFKEREMEKLRFGNRLEEDQGSSERTIPLYSKAYMEKFPLLFDLKSPSLKCFHFHLSRYKLSHCFLLQNEKLFGLKLPRHESVKVLDLVYSKWRKEVPEFLKREWLGKDSLDFMKGTERDKGKERSNSTSPIDQDQNQEDDDDEEEEDLQGLDSEYSLQLENQKSVEFLQSASLQIAYLQGTLQIHRPYLDEGGGWKEPKEAKKSLEMCINAATSLISLIEKGLRTRPPYFLSNIMVQHTFSSSSILAIHLQVQENGLLHSKSGANARQAADQETEPLKRALKKGLEVLDGFNTRKTFGNISEQAGRYAATIRELLGALPKEGAMGPGGAASEIVSRTPTMTQEDEEAWNGNFQQPQVPNSIPQNGWTIVAPASIASYYGNQPQQQPSTSHSFQQPYPFDPRPTPQSQEPIQALSPASAAWLYRPLGGIPPDRPLPPPGGGGGAKGAPARVQQEREPPMGTMDLDQLDLGLNYNSSRQLLPSQLQGQQFSQATFQKSPQISSQDQGWHTQEQQQQTLRNSSLDSDYYDPNLNSQYNSNPYQMQPTTYQSSDPKSSLQDSIQSFSESIYSSAQSDPNSASNSDWNSPHTRASTGSVENRNENSYLSNTSGEGYSSFNQAGFNSFSNQPQTIGSQSQGQFNYELNPDWEIAGDDPVNNYVQEWKLWENFCEELKNQKNENV